MMETLLVVLSFFSFIGVCFGILAASTEDEERVIVFGYCSIVLFVIFFGLCLWTISEKDSYQERIITDYCNGKIVVDTVAVTKDGNPYHIKIRRE